MDQLALEKKLAELQDFTHRHLAEKIVRYFAEATYLFDE
jgi:hypothetical protein